MKLYKEEERICRELGNVDSLQRSLGEQAVILHARGDLKGAMELHKKQERICRELSNVEGLAHSLAQQAVVLALQNHLPEALAAAEEAYRLASGHGYAALANQILPIVEARRRDMQER
jgi:hypothetical protein